LTLYRPSDTFRRSNIYGAGKQWTCFSLIDNGLYCLRDIAFRDDFVGETIVIGPEFLLQWAALLTAGIRALVAFASTRLRGSRNHPMAICAFAHIRGYRVAVTQWAILRPSKK
jgi:hypothetical protein